MGEPVPFEVESVHLRLCAFAAVNHEQVAAEIDHLAGRLVARRWGSRTAAEYVNGELCHSDDKVTKRIVKMGRFV